ncbi:hypothetical protein [Nostoc edaphicum]|nr:hypothetical protein [Nostoc edaphicum]
MRQPHRGLEIGGIFTIIHGQSWYFSKHRKSAIAQKILAHIWRC